MDDRKRILERNFCAQSYEEREEWCNAFESVKLEHQRRTSFRKLDSADLANFVDMDMIKKQNYNSVKKEDFRPIKNWERAHLVLCSLLAMIKSILQ